MPKQCNEGSIRRLPDGTVEVSITGKTSLAGMPDVICDNPEDPEDQRIYRKIFSETPIYLPDEYDKAVREILRTGNDIIVLGANGYSSLTEEKCQAWGVRHGAYAAACESLLYNMVRFIQDHFPGVDIRFAHGASHMGVDGAIIATANALNRPQLGHSCPKFMFYVEDNGIPVYVANTQAEYADAFIESLDILVAANGRKQAFQHDIAAAFEKLKHVIPVNVLRSISDTGGPPAIGADGHIEDAVAAFEQRVHMMAMQLGFTTADRWTELVEHLNATTITICRRLLSPARAFQVTKPA